MNAPPRLSHSHSRSLSESQSQSQSQSQGRGGPPLPRNLYAQYEEPSPPETIGSSNYTNDHFEIPPSKRQRLSGPSVAGVGPGSSFPRSTLASPPDGTAALKAAQVAAGRRPSVGRPPTPVTAAPVVPTGKSKRVRTGCLTCRDRHLKCDETLPDCLNCRKSNRACSRGIRLNFIDIQCKGPPTIPPTVEWSVQFQDDSRLIASEYQGGLGRYAPFDRPDITPPREVEVDAALQQQQHQQPRPQPSGLPQPYAQYDMSSSSRDLGRPASHGMYYQNCARPPQPEYPVFDETQSQRNLLSRRNSAAFAPVGRQQQQQHPQVMQTQPMQQNTNYGGQFSLAALQEQFSTRDDGTRHSHSYKSSEMTSVTSSLVPQHAGPASQSFRPPYLPGQQPSGPQDGIITPPSEKTTGERDYLNEEEEIHYMQVFINEVAIWMDSLDHQKHFSRVVPYLALKSPMLLNALLACGVKHLTLTTPGQQNAADHTNNVHVYYDTATTQLLRSLQNPDRNMAECATTAVVLNVYEIMSEKPAARMSHIAGARALIRECGWDAKSTGIASACFWLNIGMELLSCLAFNWQTAWDPDQWGLDLSFINNSNHSSLDGEGPGRMGNDDGGAGNTGHERHVRNAYDLGGGKEEEAWVHRIFYIVAKVANFRANIPRFQEPSPHDEQVRLQSRFAEWKRLKAMCDTWNNSCPRPMRPFGYAHRRSSKSLFPNVMLIRRAAVVGRLFYHTAMCLLAQINPLEPSSTEENRAAQLHHAHQVCGIVAHTKDHGVASVAIRSLTIASSVLVDNEEQREVLAILNRIHQDTGWRLGNVLNELKKAWGWGSESAGVTMLAPLGPPPPGGGYGGGMGQAMMPMPRPVNPLLAKADFSHPDHPYPNWYRPPNGQNAGGAQGFWVV